MAKYDKADIERRMSGAVESFKSDLSGLRTGRANTTLLDPIQVEVYGAMMPLNQVATVSAPEPRMLSVQVWDRANMTPVEKAIRQAGLGLNPMIDGQNIRLPIPDLTAERRKELAKLAGHYAAFKRAKERLINARKEIAVCSISGAVGTYATVSPEVQKYVAEKLGLAEEDHLAIQHMPREQQADMRVLRQLLRFAAAQVGIKHQALVIEVL